MPELPEVETITNAFKAELDGKQFCAVDFFRDDLRFPFKKDLIQNILVETKIKTIFRRSKMLVVQTEQGFVALHFGMSGFLFFSESKTISYPHTHIIFSIKNPKKNEKKYLHFVDPRRFGFVEAWLGSNLNENAKVKHLGIEPLEAKDLGEVLYQKTRKKMMPIKNLIMDHKIVVGVGNIYAAEALFLSKISPLRKSETLSKKESVNLALAIQKVLKDAIKKGGTTFRDFRHTNGAVGKFSKHLNVYARDGKECFLCGHIIAVSKQAGRSSFFCSFCQK